MARWVTTGDCFSAFHIRVYPRNPRENPNVSADHTDSRGYKPRIWGADETGERDGSINNPSKSQFIVGHPRVRCVTRLALEPRLAFLAGMDLETARRHIQTYLDRMRASYRQPLFDEWAVLGVTGGAGSVLAYAGPRVEVFRTTVAQDSVPLRSRTAGKQLAEGDIEFAADAPGTQYDAFMKLGPTSYLVLNHTTKTLAEIRSDSKWLGAQAVLFELSEKFRADPLEL